MCTQGVRASSRESRALRGGGPGLLMGGQGRGGRRGTPGGRSLRLWRRRRWRRGTGRLPLLAGDEGMDAVELGLDWGRGGAGGGAVGVRGESARRGAHLGAAARDWRPVWRQGVGGETIALTASEAGDWAEAGAAGAVRGKDAERWEGTVGREQRRQGGWWHQKVTECRGAARGRVQHAPERDRGWIKRTEQLRGPRAGDPGLMQVETEAGARLGGAGGATTAAAAAAAGGGATRWRHGRHHGDIRRRVGSGGSGGGVATEAGVPGTWRPRGQGLDGTGRW